MARGDYILTVGLELHAELKTRTKMFCASKNDSDEARPNVNVCPICLGHPGTLPVINKEAVKHVLKVGLALGGTLADFTEFDRKNYFYPDIPKGYQISQYTYPLVTGGILNDVAITRVHLEEDTATSLHNQPDKSDRTNQSNQSYSLLNFNRAGVPLLELVTEPVIRSATEAGNFARELQLLLRYLGVSDANMEKGEMRVEANVSVARSNRKRMPANDKRIVLKEESYRLMGYLFEIHNELGTTYKEKNYQDAIEAVLQKEQIPYEREKEIAVMLGERKVSSIFADFVAEGKILLEIKATKFITQEDIRQVLRYIKSLNVPLGIIVNFRREKLEYKRIINPTFDNNSVPLDSYSGALPLGTKVEVKNLNSFRAVERAIVYEYHRQVSLLGSGKKVLQETRGWDEHKEITFSQRRKEESHDYRYFPDPDLPKLAIRDVPEFAPEHLAQEMPELPAVRRARYQNLGIKAEDAMTLTVNRAVATLFEETAALLPEKDAILLAANYLTSDLMGLLNASSPPAVPRSSAAADTTGAPGEDSGVVGGFRFTPEAFAELIRMVQEKKLSSRGAKDILSVMYENGGKPEEIARERGLLQQSDEASLRKIAERIIAENQGVATDYKKGKPAALQFFIGQGMKATKGAANPEMLREIFVSLLK